MHLRSDIWSITIWIYWGFVPKAVEPDRVHVLAELAKTYKENRFLLKADTAVNGDKDSNGRVRIYNTLTDLSVNRAQIDSIKTIFVNRTQIGVGNFDYSILPFPTEALQLALGESETGSLLPGGALPFINFLGYTLASQQIPDEALIRNELLPFLAFPPAELNMNLADYRRLIHLKQKPGCRC